MENLLGNQYCDYLNTDPKDYYIFNPGDKAKITGEGGFFTSREYAQDLGADMKKIIPRNLDSSWDSRYSEYFVGKTGEVKNRIFWANSGTKICLIEVDNRQVVVSMSYLKPIEINQYSKQRRDSMNFLIAEMYPKTKDALLVNKYFSCDVVSIVDKIALEGKEDRLLEEAKRLEEEETKEK